MKSVMISTGDFNRGIILARLTPTFPSSDTMLFHTLYPGDTGHWTVRNQPLYSHFRFATSVFNTLGNHLSDKSLGTKAIQACQCDLGAGEGYRTDPPECHHTAYRTTRGSGPVTMGL